MSLLTLLVVYAGIGGDGAARVERQVQSLLDRSGGDIQVTDLGAKKRHELASHGKGARKIVQSLHASGVVVGELDDLTLRIVVYGPDGAMIDLVEQPLEKAALGRDDLDALRDTIVPDVQRLAKAGADADDAGDDDAPVPAAKAKAKAKAKASKTAKDAEPVDDVAVTPSKKRGKVKPKVEVEPEVEVDAEPEAEPTAEAAPDEVAVADDASADDDELGLGLEGEVEAEDDAPPPALHLRVAAGIGVAGRTFVPGPSTIPAYISSPVPAARIGAEVAPTSRIAVDVQLERTLALTTQVGGVAAASSILRWQADATYHRQLGRFEAGAVGGIGRREFVIESKDPSRSPDGQYLYLVAGGHVGIRLGSRVGLAVRAAVEPVVAGAQPTAMAFGSATRWAVDVGATLEVDAGQHIFVAGTFDYQRFMWSFGHAGNRGAGGATDEYPAGALAIGARY